MKFTAVLFAGLAAAIPTNRVNGTAPDPSTYDNIDISSLNVRETLEGNTLKVTGIESVSFLLNTNVTCAADAPGTEGKVFPCGSTPYSFGLINGTTTQFGLRIYKATSQLYVFPPSSPPPTCRYPIAGD